MQGDRELLERAACAAGFEGVSYGELSGGAPVLYVPGLGVVDWLGDDGDALRLAGKLRMSLRVEDYGSSARIDGKPAGAWYGCEAHLYGGTEAATRRAIVRAAAALAPAAKEPQR